MISWLRGIILLSMCLALVSVDVKTSIEMGCIQYEMDSIRPTRQSLQSFIEFAQEDVYSECNIKLGVVECCNYGILGSRLEFLLDSVPAISSGRKKMVVDLSKRFTPKEVEDGFVIEKDTEKKVVVQFVYMATVK